MRHGGRILVLLGLILGVVAAGGTFLVVSSSQPQGVQLPTRSVVIAQQNIPARTEISPSSIGKGEWPEAYLPVGAYQNTGDVSGKLAVETIHQGQIILPGMLIDKTQVKETRSNASFMIPEGKIAVAFPLSALTGVAGAIQAGDTVDMLLTLDPSKLTSTRGITGTAPLPGTEGLPVTQMMLQDVLILNVGTWPAAGTKDQAAATSNTITLVLDRQDALALKAARELGSIDLVLRRAGDHKPVTTEPVTLQYLNKRFNFALLPNTR